MLRTKPHQGTQSVEDLWDVGSGALKGTPDWGAILSAIERIEGARDCRGTAPLCY